MDATERRDEIMRILISRRFETMPRLAEELCVSRITIVRDILTLTAKYPLETSQGNKGGVKLADWYRPNKNLLTNEQKRVMASVSEKLGNCYESNVLREILVAFS